MSHTQHLRHRLHMVSRGPGGPFERADYEWVRECRKAGWSLKLIASYFEPQPSSATLRQVLREKIAPRNSGNAVDDLGVVAGCAPRP